MEIKLQNKVISEQSPTFIVAEAGVNHNGSLTVAKELIDVAVHAGADAVKFQSFRPSSLVLEAVEKAPYQKETTESRESQRSMLEKLALDAIQVQELAEHAEKRGIIFLTTPFDEKSLEDLDQLNLPAYKIASTDTTNLPFLRKIADRGKPVFLSTGMSYLEEVDLAVRVFQEAEVPFVLMQCSANYPIQDQDANLSVISTYLERYGCLVGYSDHTEGVGASPYAVVLGACMVEKHFCLDPNAEGPDQRCSLSPRMLNDFVAEVRRAENFVGSAFKFPSLAETHTRGALQKCLVAKAPIKLGETLSGENMIAKRTGGVGISPFYFDALDGTRAKREFQVDEIIEC